MAYVGVGLRFVAIVIDTVILVILGYIVALLTGETRGMGFQLTGTPALGVFIVGLAYFVILETTRGGTVGKLVLGLRVTRADGRPLGWGASFIRNILRIIDGLLFYLVGAIFVWASRPQPFRVVKPSV